MKIISLNTWGGRAGEKRLLDFLKNAGQTTDVLCLQEIWSVEDENTMLRFAEGLEIIHKDIMFGGVKKISSALENFNYYFRPHYKDDYGLLTLVKKEIKVKDEGELFVHKHKGYVSDSHFGHHARNIQFVRLEFSGKEILVVNFHGLWNGKGKEDSEDRLNQSKMILNFLKEAKALNIILCGDFNLLPDTKSLKMFEEFGLHNLVIKNGITSTRSHYYDKPEKHANYIFVSDSIRVKKFEVLSEVVSDHLALALEIEDN